MLDVIDLDFDYQDRPLLAHVSFYLPPGGLLHLRGPNGAGKTTLLKLITGIYTPTSGSIKFAGQSIEHNKSEYQQQLCFVGHKTGVNPYLTLRENCYFDLHNHNNSTDFNKLAALFNLESHIDSLCGLLSAGQRRQAGLLRLWMTDAQLWLLDEPLVALDDSALSLIMAKIEQHRAGGGLVLLTSHQNLPLKKSHYQEYCL